jgi:hypothetical protein
MRVSLLVFALIACSREEAKPPPPPPAPRPADHCSDFVAFAFRCGIGKPPPDPTVDIGTQRNNDLVVMQGVIEQCREHRPPYDEGLIRCFLDAHGDCAVYSTCADKVVAARPQP